MGNSTEHSRFSPSQLSRIIKCPGSVQLSETLPEPPESEYAKEGTYLHDVAANVLLNCINLGWSLNDALDTVEWQSLEHRHAVSACLERVMERRKELGELSTLWVEQSVTCGDERVYGTADCVIIGKDSIYVIDYKFGQGVEVEVKDNPQLLAYLDGTLKTLGHFGPDNPKMFMWVMQPRRNNFPCVEVTPEELEKHRETVTKAVDEAESTTPSFSPGEDQCRWCRASAVCKKRMEHVVEKAKEAFKVFADHSEDGGFKAETCSTEYLASILKHKKEVVSAYEAIEKHLFVELLNDREVPGFKLVTGRGSRRWADNVDIDVLGNCVPSLDTEDILDVKLKSPAQVEAMLSSEDKKKIQELIVKTEGNLTLASDASKKEAVGMGQGDKAQRAFKNVMED
jgi:hypothetical protein